MDIGFNNLSLANDANQKIIDKFKEWELTEVNIKIIENAIVDRKYYHYNIVINALHKTTTYVTIYLDLVIPICQDDQGWWTVPYDKIPEIDFTSLNYWSSRYFTFSIKHEDEIYHQIQHDGEMSYFLMRNVNYEKIVCDYNMILARETAIQWFIENRIGDFYPEYAPDVC